MTLQEIIESEKEHLTANDVAPLMGCDAMWIRNAARNYPDKLGFSTFTSGNHVHIMRRSFLNFMGVNMDDKDS